MTPAAAPCTDQPGRALPDASAPVVTTKGQSGLLAPGKALRLLCMLWDGLEELHRITPDDPARRALVAAHRAALVEVASTVSDPLIGELVELGFAPLDPDATVAEIRVAEAQLFGWLNGLILADEQRHHRLFADLAETFEAEAAELRADGAPVPPISVRRLPENERQRILALTDRFLAFERQDARDLEHLAKTLEPVKETTLWHLLVRLMRADTEKHIRILRFIRDRVRHAGR